MGCENQRIRQTPEAPAEQQIEPHEKITLNNYHLEKVCRLAEGAFGKIWQCKDLSTGEKYALKEISLRLKTNQEAYKTEVALLTKLKDHQLQGAIKMKTCGIHVTKNHVSIGRILFELGGKTLFDEINERDISERQALIILRDVSLALHQLHSIGIYHLDVKPENIIMVGNSYKLCDFGSVLTKTVVYDAIGQDEKDDIVEYITFNSTQIYRSPELIDPRGKVIGAPADIWMLGCIAYILAHGKHPFAEGELESIVNYEVDFPLKSGYLAQLTQQLMAYEPHERPSAGELAWKISAKLEQQKKP